MKQKAQWLSHVVTRSKIAEQTAMPSGSPACFSTRPRSSAAPAELEGDDGFVGEQLVVDHVAEADPFSARISSPTPTPASLRRRRGRDALDLRKRHPPSVAGGLASLSAVEVDRVLLAEPRGFCAGVEMAIKALAWMVRVFEPPVYCYHEIVHNRLVVEEFSPPGRRLRRRRRRSPPRGAAHALRPRLGA